MSRPNVLWIISDQHNAKCLGVTGHPDAKTPHLDRLSREGVRFVNAITQNPICTPSRMSFLSGQYPHNHGYYGLNGRAPVCLPSILGHFGDAGYYTAAIGKIHDPSCWIEGEVDLLLEAYSYAGIGFSHYQHYLERRGLAADRDDAYMQEWLESDPYNRRAAVDARASRLPYEESVEGWCVREAQAFIAGSKGQPWAIQVSLPRPHSQWTPSEPFWSMYDEDKLMLPPNVDYDMSLKSPHTRAVRKYHEDSAATWSAFGPPTYRDLRRRILHGYLGCVSQVDHAVGELLDYLDAHGLAENTIVIYTSDHGDFAGEHGIIEKAPGIPADAITRIPYIWRWPGQIKAGLECAPIVESVDLATTLTSLCELGPFHTGDGMDLSSLLRGDGGEGHRIGVTEGPLSKSVRKGPWRMVFYPRGFFKEEGDREIGDLYNLDDDPWEMHNLFYDPAYHHIVEELRLDLLEWLVRTTRPVTIHPNVDLRRGGGNLLNHRLEADRKLSWHDVANQTCLNYL